MRKFCDHCGIKLYFNQKTFLCACICLSGNDSPIAYSIIKCSKTNGLKLSYVEVFLRHLFFQCFPRSVKASPCQEDCLLFLTTLLKLRKLYLHFSCSHLQCCPKYMLPIQVWTPVSSMKFQFFPRYPQLDHHFPVDSSDLI